MVIGGNPEISIVIRAVDEFSKTLNKAVKSISDVKGTLIGVGAVAGVTFAATTAAVMKSVNSFAEFDAKIQKAGANVNASAETLEKFREVAINATRGTAISAAEAAHALSFLAGGSVDAEEAMATLGDTINFAIAGNISLEKAAVISSQAMTVFKIKAEDVSSVLDVLARANQISFATMDQLSDAFQEVGPIAAQVGVNIVDLTAMIGAMGDAGILGSEAGVALKRAFIEILNPTKSMEEGLGKLGLTVSDLQKNLNDPIKVLEMLETQLQNIQDPIERATILSEIFGRVSGPAMMALLNQGTDAIRYQQQMLEEAGGTLGDVTDAVNNAISPFTLLKQEMDRLSISLGQALNPVIKELIAFITPIIQRITEWIQLHPKLTAAIIIVVSVVSGLTVAVIALSLAVLAFQVIAWPVVLVVMAVVAAIALLIAIGYLLYKHWGDIVAFIQKYFAPEIEAIKLLINLLGIAFKYLWEHYIKPVWNNLKTFIGWISDIVGPIIKGIINIIGKVIGAIGEARSAQAERLSAINVGLKGSKQLGGIIPTTGTYFMQKGEEVIPSGYAGRNIIYNITIENINGLTGRDIARELQNEIKNSIRLS